MSASLALGPPQHSARYLFLKSQFLSPPHYPPSTLSLTGKTALVTGSSTGLGLEASRQLLSHGLSTLILGVRSPEKGEAVAATFRAQYPRANIRVWALQMESYDSVRAFAQRVEQELARCDIAILNAATVLVDFVKVAATRHETVLQVNYLSTFLLAVLLLPVLKAKAAAHQAGPARLTIVSSGAVRGGSIAVPSPSGPGILASLDDPSAPWNPLARYMHSKLLGQLFMAELADYIDPADVIVNLVDPGLVKGTELSRDGSFVLRLLFGVYMLVAGRGVRSGASTYVDAVGVQGGSSHGGVCGDWGVVPFAAFVYTPEGEKARKLLWEETLDEFEFAHAREVLDGLRK